MRAVFGRYVGVCDHDNYLCRVCSRWFKSKSAILAHCRSTRAHAWCERCERVFLTEEAKQKHIQQSGSHVICSLCDHRPEFASRAQLDQHSQDVHFPCRTGTCNLIFSTSFDLQDHLVSRHFACEECLRTFDNQNNLSQHMKAHEDKYLHCPVCDRRFARWSFVLLHLERSRCSSIRKVNALAFSFHEQNYLYDFIKDDRRFYCEDCDSGFDQLSSLFQHAEDSVSCSYPFSSDLHLVAQHIFNNIH